MFRFYCSIALGGLTKARLTAGLMGAAVFVSAIFSSSLVRQPICRASIPGLVEPNAAASLVLVAVVVAGKLLVRWCGVWAMS